MSAWYRIALLNFFSIVIHVQRSNYQLHAVQLWTGCTEFYNLTWSQSRNEINTHTEHKNTMICFNWKEAIWSLTKKKTRKQERKANRIITFDSENSKKVEL